MYKLEDALKYYIEYESHNRLNNVVIPTSTKVENTCISNNTHSLTKYITQKKRDEIAHIFSYEFNNLEHEKTIEFLDVIFKFEGENISEFKNTFKENLRILNANVVKATEDRINEAILLLVDDYITILSPIYDQDNENTHLVGYRCYTKDDLSCDSVFRVNRDGLGKLKLNKVGFALDEALEASKETCRVF